MRRAFHAGVLLGLALLPVEGRSGSPGDVALIALASQAEGAVVARAARDFSLHAPDALNLLGVSFPELAAREAGTLKGSAGALRVVDPAHLGSMGIDVDTPMAVLRFPMAPAPVIALSGVTAERCKQIRASLHAGPPENAESWARRGLCLMVVGECLDAMCGPIGLKPPAAVPPRIAALVDGLAGEGLLGLVPGATLERMAPREARAALRDVDAVAVRWRRTEAGLAGDAAILMKHAVKDPGLRLLAGAALPTSEKALVELSFMPNAAALKDVTHWLKGALGRHADGLLGPNAVEPLQGAQPTSLTLSWLGIDAAVMSPDHPEDALMGFHGVLSGAAGTEERASRTVLALDTRLRAQGFALDGRGTHTRAPHTALRVHRDGSHLAVATGRSAAGTPDLAWEPATAPPDATLRLRMHGRRIHGALAGIPLLHGAATPELRAALGARELIGPSLLRLGAVSAWFWLQRGKTVRVQFSAAL